MSTEAQILANRRNAQKSTGPRTPRGKAIVSQNAITHGLSARQAVISSESRGPTSTSTETSSSPNWPPLHLWNLCSPSALSTSPGA
ncbi:hypothetical protein ACFL1G_02025 [Planctomycetota bacterium]